MKSKQRLNNPVSVRFPAGIEARLSLVSRRYQIKKSEVVRRALEQKLPEWENGNRIVIEADRRLAK